MCERHIASTAVIDNIKCYMLLFLYDGTERYKGFDMCHVFKITHLFLCIITSDYRDLIWQYTVVFSQMGQALPKGLGDSTLNREDATSRLSERRSRKNGGL
jgi:hypothetical protein